MLRDLILILFLIFLFGCSSEVDLQREPDLQSNLLSLDEKYEKETYLGVVNDNMTPKERNAFNLPDEWEAYRIEFNHSTRFIDHEGAEIEKEAMKSHNFKFNIWTEESFKSEWSNVEVKEGTSMAIITDLFPLYTATQVQLVPMTDEEYLERSYAYEEGEIAIEVYINEAFYEKDDRMVPEEIYDRSDNFNRFSSTSSEASKRKERLLNIEEYPVFLVYDHEGLVLKTYDIHELLEFLDRIESYKN
ncbi:hypothetical protein [Desertibacillus haloalkaliphilus]|uniref:hypothetical protein n=1 Tax=Desertibacillus haloalkaliphilus TaxID=1328930 RepID=UPI001C2809C1|nr:hypothetical protein [Desertibacillus haloalkaliphilus]MBU8906267.1 hypothetical protein [Desertibacillus haloalkaliphilus]